MRLISLNVAVFEKNNEKLESFLQNNKLDIVCFQEVSRKVGNKVDPALISFDTLTEATPGLSNSFFAPVWIVKDFVMKNFHGAVEFHFEYGDWLEFGLLTRAKYPISYARLEFVQGSLSMQTDWSSWPEKDNRAVQVTDLMIASEKPNLRLINYHGLWSRGKEGNEKTLKANKQILALAKEVDYPVIICGDFNLFPDTKSMKILTDRFESLVDTFEIKTTRPLSNELSGSKRNVVDYVMVSKGVKVKNLIVPDSDVSDHLPMILDFEL